MKLAITLLCLLLAGCAAKSTTDPGQTNRNRLATVEASYGAVQSAALVYARRPLCPAPTPVCADRGVVRTMQAADRSSMAAIETVHTAVATNPTAATIPTLIDAAMASVTAFQAVTPSEKQP